MNLFADELTRMRQAELLAEAEAYRCCRPTGGRRRRPMRGRRRLVNGSGSPDLTSHGLISSRSRGVTSS